VQGITVDYIGRTAAPDSVENGIFEMKVGTVKADIPPALGVIMNTLV
jgi:hypothetical protein